jgi:hypothetical protein
MQNCVRPAAAIHSPAAARRAQQRRVDVDLAATTNGRAGCDPAPVQSGASLAINQSLSPRAMGDSATLFRVATAWEAAAAATCIAHREPSRANVPSLGRSRPSPGACRSGRPMRARCGRRQPAAKDMLPTGSFGEPSPFSILLVAVYIAVVQLPSSKCRSQIVVVKSPSSNRRHQIVVAVASIVGRPSRQGTARHGADPSSSLLLLLFFFLFRGGGGPVVGSDRRETRQPVAIIQLVFFSLPLRSCRAFPTRGITARRISPGIRGHRERER